MRRLWVCLMMTGALGFSAAAKEPDWSGFYAGMSAGSYKGTALPPDFATAGTVSVFNGAAYGAQLGYIWQQGIFLVGAEVDLTQSTGTERQSLTDVIIPGLLVVNADAARRQNWLATARLRAGVLVHPNFFVFASGGLASANIDTSLFVSQTILCGCGDIVIPLVEGRESGMTFGGVFSFGAEYAFSTDVRVKIEYTHYDLGRSEMNVQSYPGPISSVSLFENNASMVRVGVNFALSGDAR